LEIDSRQGQGIFLYSTASSPALGPTQPPVQWVLGGTFNGVKPSVGEAYRSPPFTQKYAALVHNFRNYLPQRRFLSSRVYHCVFLETQLTFQRNTTSHIFILRKEVVMKNEV
jgi:hypothetical protein